MAITNAQQYKQLLAKGGRIGLKGGADASEFGKSGSNVNVSSSGSVSKSRSVSPGAGNSRRGNDGVDDRSSALQTYNTKKATGRLGRQDREGGELQYKNGVLIDETGRPVDDTFRGGFTGDLTDNEKTLETFIDSKANYPSYTPAYVKFLADLNRRPNRKYFVENVLRAGKIPGVDYSMLGEDEFDIEQAYKDYMSNRLAGKTDAMGNPMSGFEYGDDGILTGNFMDNGGGDTTPGNGDGDGDGDDNEDEEGNTNREKGLALRFMNRGGMPMDAPTEGGIMDLESGRQMYFLGKLVKKATRTVKKIAKSPIGKAALLYAGTGGLGNLASGKAFFSNFMSPTNFLAKKNLSNIFTKKGIGNILFGGQRFTGNPIKGAAIDFSGLFGKGGKFGLGQSALTLSMLLPFLTEEQKQQLENEGRGVSLDTGYIRENPYTFKSQVGSGRGLGFNFADGGRIGYQEGSKEPVARKTMPLLDMDGMEKDYREDGGFVPIGRMERADDVPARLSKNEFVFTADAVRNAGEGDIDKGAEVMYNMMKNLEAGGEVSEESQGLEGARKMFQTSKRLEEVL